MSNGQIPIIIVEAITLPEAWEKTALEVYKRGLWIQTQYDVSGEAPSLDCTGIVKVINPISEPRIHKNIPEGYEGLVKYAIDFCENLYGWKVEENEVGFSYSYPHRFRQHFGFDQVETLLDKIEECYYSRRNQITTWNPKEDLGAEDSPCLQRIWIRLVENDAQQLILNLNSHWRSRDLWKAWFMNAYALVYFQMHLSKKLTKRMKRDVVPGRYLDISDSLHINGRDQNAKEIEKMLTSSFLARSISSKDPVFVEATVRALEEIQREKEERRKKLEKEEKERKATEVTKLESKAAKSSKTRSKSGSGKKTSKSKTRIPKETK